jgi:hypothetical protein
MLKMREAYFFTEHLHKAILMRKGSFTLHRALPDSTNQAIV